MPIDYSVVQSKPQVHKHGVVCETGVSNQAVKFKSRSIIKVAPGHTIFELQNQQRKQRSADDKTATHIKQQIKRGKLKYKDGQVVEEDAFGIMPDKKIGLSGRIMEKIKLMFGGI